MSFNAFLRTGKILCGKKCGIARNIQSHFFLLFDLLISSNLKMPLKEDSINYFFFLKDKPYLFINYNKKKKLNYRFNKF